MEFYPFFPRPYYYTHYRNMQNREYARNEPQKAQTNRTAKNESNRQEERTYQKQTNLRTDENPIFEIFGIRLFFDDILIISLIFFLYSEGVTDNLLFISLILILLT